jgi:hypothetical protein
MDQHYDKNNKNGSKTDDLDADEDPIELFRVLQRKERKCHDDNNKITIARNIRSSGDPNKTLQQVAASNNMNPNEATNLLQRNCDDLEAAGVDVQQAMTMSGGKGGGSAVQRSNCITGIILINYYHLSTAKVIPNRPILLEEVTTPLLLLSSTNLWEEFMTRNDKEKVLKDGNLGTIQTTMKTLEDVTSSSV